MLDPLPWPCSGISVLTGSSFLSRAIHEGGGIGGYATVGGIFFLISTIRLSILLRNGRGCSR